ncbi:MAG: BCD family MFS transporter [Gemmatimonadota bacterium]
MTAATVPMPGTATPAAAPTTFGWPQVVRIGLVQACLGAVVVLMTATLNRVMVVELGLPASVPGVLVLLHFVVQLWLRPRLGFGADRSGRRTAWIVGGVALLAASGVAASATTMLIERSRPLGLAAAAVAFVFLGAGVSGAGTPLLAILAERVPERRRSAAAATVWLMMIAGFIVTTLLASRGLAPYSHARLVSVTAAVGLTCMVVTCLAVIGLDRGPRVALAAAEATTGASFAGALRGVLREPVARAFSVFIFLSMFAYSAQDLILEPYAGLVYGLSPRESTAISGMHQAGLLVGMLLCAALAMRVGTPRHWASVGCAASAVFFVALALSPLAGSVPLLRVILMGLGVANGAFAIGAISTMMTLTADAGDRTSGLRMGIFGAAQAVGTGIGQFLGAAGSDVSRALLGGVSLGYGAVFGAEALMFTIAAYFAMRSAPTARLSAGAVQGQSDRLLAVMH